MRGRSVPIRGDRKPRTLAQYHTATLLPNGKVLVAGGQDSGYNILASAELYDPATGTWTATGSLATARYSHGDAAAQRQGARRRRIDNSGTFSPARNSTIRRAGPGRPPAASPPRADFTPRRCCPTARCSSQADYGSVSLASAELYDPATGTWTATGSLATDALCSHGDVAAQRQGARRRRFGSSGFSRARSSTIRRAAPGRPPAASPPHARDHTATLLPNGKVLVAGGFDNGGSLASAELYDPATGTWTATGASPPRATITPRRCCPTARCSSQAADIGDLAISRARNSTIRRRHLDRHRQPRHRTRSHTATLLPNGKVLVAGGYDCGGYRQRGALRSGERHLDATGSLVDRRAIITPRRCCPTARCSSQEVPPAALSRSAELYDPASGTWSATGSLATDALDHTATLLPNGKVLVAGGTASGVLASAELYDPASGTWTATGSLATARYVHTATLLPNGKVLVAGGFDDAAALSRARNSTIRPPGLGPPPAASPPRADLTPRRCCPTARCSSQAVGSSGRYLASAELYDPATGTWTATGSLATARCSSHRDAAAQRQGARRGRY